MDEVSNTESKKEKNNKLLITITIVLLILIAIWMIFFDKNSKSILKIIPSVSPTPYNSVGIANPASVFCLEKGGKLEIRKNEVGEIGFCVFSTGKECEEWAMYRNECPIGGR